MGAPYQRKRRGPKACQGSTPAHDIIVFNLESMQRANGDIERSMYKYIFVYTFMHLSLSHSGRLLQNLLQAKGKAEHEAEAVAEANDDKE